ncbi:DUF2946 domain-containing protein [Rhizobium sp. 18055]|uniref:DUF2946 domain-containing protein n=1 Tax=Rhizobium sp. 18055 TaxID=2681403 RepID=UPI00135AA726|nr:DUF2946 domain-containing protein [Rhizobium sp. 18055]
MGMIRTILRDRVSTSAITLLVACLLMIQGLLSGQAQGAMAVMAVDPLHSICSTAGEISAAQAESDDHSHGSSHGKAADCPCGTLCRLASHAMPAILGADDSVAYTAVETAITTAFALETSFTPTLRGRIAQPRAPPSIS